MKDKSSHVGLRHAYKIKDMPQGRQISFISEGLPLILENAQKLYDSACLLTDTPHHAAILINYAKEEAAKILILMDFIRCPQKRIASENHKLIKWFYNHLARLIYADCAQWRPVDVSELKRYVVDQRKTHYLDGYIGEHIFPNMALYVRESQLYVDVAILDSEDPTWVSPLHDGFSPLKSKPLSLDLVEAMNGLGLFSTKGLKLVSEIWNQVDFSSEESPACKASWNDDSEPNQVGAYESEQLMKELFVRVQQENICNGDDIQAHINRLFQNWQFPMYDFDLSPITVTQEELENEQVMYLANDMGY